MREPLSICALLAGIGLVALYAAAIQEQQKEIDRLWLAFSALLITWGVSFGYLYRRAA